MQRNVTSTAQLIDLCPECRSVLHLALIEPHPDHNKLGIYHLRCENCGKSEVPVCLSGRRRSALLQKASLRFFVFP